MAINFFDLAPLTSEDRDPRVALAAYTSRASLRRAVTGVQFRHRLEKNPDITDTPLPEGSAPASKIWARW